MDISKAKKTLVASSYSIFLADVANDYHFIPVNQRLDWHEARLHCQSLNATLATVENDEENDQVQSLTSTDYCEPR